MQAELKTSYEGVEEHSEKDFSGDLTKFDVPTLVLHRPRQTRSCQWIRRDLHSWSKELSRSSIRACRMASPPRTNIVDRDRLAFCQRSSEGRVSSIYEPRLASASARARRR